MKFIHFHYCLEQKSQQQKVIFDCIINRKTSNISKIYLYIKTIASLLRFFTTNRQQLDFDFSYTFQKIFQVENF